MTWTPNRQRESFNVIDLKFNGMVQFCSIVELQLRCPSVVSEFPEHVVEIEQRLRQIASIVRRRGRTLLEQYGITPPQFDAMWILSHDGELTIGDLSTRLYLAYSTTTDLVDRLERADFVVRIRDTEDRRVVRVRLLESGVNMIEKVLDARRSYLGIVLDNVTPDDKKAVLDVLELLYAKMGDR